MRCPFCGHLEDKVVDSRESREGDSIRRRRECLGCARRFTSYERVEEVPLLVVKKDGRREPFDRTKLLRSLSAPCQKRPVGLTRLEEVATDIQARLLERPDREISTREVGELVMDALKALDSVAYVRFASIYRDFKDLPDFVKALEGLMRKEDALPRAVLKATAPPPVPPPLPEPPAPPSVPAPKGQPTPLFPSEGLDVSPPRRKRR